MADAVDTGRKSIGDRWKQFTGGIGAAQKAVADGYNGVRTVESGVERHGQRWLDDKQALGNWADKDARFGKTAVAGMREAKAAVNDATGLARNTHAIDVETVSKLGEDAKRVALRGAEDIRHQKGAFGPSLRAAWTNMAERVGIDTSKWSAAHNGASDAKVTKVINQALKNGDKVGFWEGIASKPLRVAANRPAMAIAAIGAAVVGGGMMLVGGAQRKRAAEDAEATQMMMQQQMMAASTPSYKNSVSPQEAAMLDERMRAGGGAMSLADAELQRRAAAQAGAPVGQI